jgi:hypothetical protein
VAHHYLLEVSIMQAEKIQTLPSRRIKIFLDIIGTHGEI